MESTDLTRRTFIKNTAAATAVAMAAPVALKAKSAAPSDSPNGRLRLGFIGVGGRAQQHLKSAIKLQNDGKVEIVKGLEPTDMVVTAGHLKIRDGVPVTIVNGPSAAIATTPPAPTAAETAASNNEGATVISPAKADTLARPPTPKS